MWTQGPSLCVPVDTFSSLFCTCITTYFLIRSLVLESSAILKTIIAQWSSCDMNCNGPQPANLISFSKIGWDHLMYCCPIIAAFWPKYFLELMVNELNKLIIYKLLKALWSSSIQNMFVYKAFYPLLHVLHVVPFILYVPYNFPSPSLFIFFDQLGTVNIIHIHFIGLYPGHYIICRSWLLWGRKTYTYLNICGPWKAKN